MLDTLGWAHYRAGQYTEAVSVLERVVAKAGQFAVFRYHLGMAYLAAGNTVGAQAGAGRAVGQGAGRLPRPGRSPRHTGKTRQGLVT